MPRRRVRDFRAENMRRRESFARRAMAQGLLLIALAWAGAAQNAPAEREQAAENLVANATQALAERRAAGFLEAFERPLADKLRKPVEALAAGYDIQPALEFLSAAAADRGVSLRIDWKLELTAREGQRSLTHRERQVGCRVERRGDALRIVSFDESGGATGLFAPPNVDGAWDLLQSAARELGQPGFQAGPAAAAAGFIACFDSRMKGYEALRGGAEALAAQGEVDSTIGLESDEGTDSARTIEADWTLEVVNGETRIRILQREAQLTFKMERRGRGWAIVSAAPLDFFTK